MVIAPRKKMGWGKKILLGAVTVLTLGAAGGWFGRGHISSAYQWYKYRSDPSVVAALPGEQREAVRKARALQDRAINIVTPLIQRIELTYHPNPKKRERYNKPEMIGHLNGFLERFMLVEDEVVRGNTERGREMLASAEAELNNAVNDINQADPYSWPGKDRGNAQAQIGKLRKLLASVAAVFGL